MMHKVPNTITQRDKTLHAQQRRLLSNGFSSVSLRSYEGPIAMHVRKFLRLLTQNKKPKSNSSTTSDGGWSAPKDMAHWCDYLTFDIMLDIIYGSDSNMLEDPKNRPLLDAIATSNIRVGVMIPLHFLKGSKLERFLFPSSIIARYKFISFVRKLLADKKAEEKKEERRSIYSILMNARDGEGLSDNAIAAESTNLITAGTSILIPSYPPIAPSSPCGPRPLN